ncbi:hypothetical protein [Helicobacter suis]|uniref:Uncharacterized protein n=1 Tax=Helicobacter suis TaxID=104628 RepID=A0A6J4D0N3_9HELI|nr:hypothetical protein [Helicobacter suis]BCD46683.1 hypothetical protein NHP190020_17220 [Helicobacter suis]BCD47410.1 hypothetical protein NHP194003_06140 [Helicobacter suis]BCD49164.1 hypothetical protein NHP194004_06110 [Helicobacter suis]BCD51195.1 hypothetical protein NHP194022_08660 [Helicobacter suis]BCD71015.1 hypothetical protein SNTW_16600 [Helicobacter suis]
MLQQEDRLIQIKALRQRLHALRTEYRVAKEKLDALKCRCAELEEQCGCVDSASDDLEIDEEQRCC